MKQTAEFRVHDAHAGVGLQPKALMKVESVTNEGSVSGRSAAATLL
jgi:hypothetical protein